MWKGGREGEGREGGRRLNIHSLTFWCLPLLYFHTVGRREVRNVVVAVPPTTTTIPSLLPPSFNDERRRCSKGRKEGGEEQGGGEARGS